MQKSQTWQLDLPKVPFDYGVLMYERESKQIVPFRAMGEGWDGAEEDRRTRDLLDRVNAGGRVFLSGATVGGRFVARICVLCFRTDLARLEEGLHAIEAARVAQRG